MSINFKTDAEGDVHRTAPAIAIDGPSGVGKSSIGKKVAKELRFHYLNTGKIYRGIGLEVAERSIDVADTAAVTELAQKVKIDLSNDRIIVDQSDWTDFVSMPTAENMAKQVSVIPGVRAALRHHQKAQQIPPGLVADGRDMWEVFGTPYKFYLDAALEERARRRFMQMLTKGERPVRSEVEKALAERDHSDRTRPVAPLICHPEAIYIDSTRIPEVSVVQIIIAEFIKLYSSKRS